MMDIQPNDLRYFFEIAKTLNLSRAAERLNLGQPALSQALRRMEESLQVKLVDRFKSGVQLTAAGRRLLHEGRLTIDHWDQLKARVLATDNEIEGHYSIGCHTAVALYTLPVFLRPLLDDHPRLEIGLVHGLSREILEDVISFRVDFGLVMNPIRHPDLILKPLCEDKVSFWRTAKTNENTLIFDPALSQAQSLMKKVTTKRHETHAPFLRYLHSSSLEVIASLAEAECGIAILPTRVARRYDRLLPADSLPEFVRDKLYLAYRADRHLTAAARVIIQAISQAKI